MFPGRPLNFLTIRTVSNGVVWILVEDIFVAENPHDLASFNSHQTNVATDIHMYGVFRQAIGIPDDMLPDAWRRSSADIMEEEDNDGDGDADIDSIEYWCPQSTVSQEQTDESTFSTNTYYSTRLRHRTFERARGNSWTWQTPWFVESVSFFGNRLKNSSDHKLYQEVVVVMSKYVGIHRIFFVSH